MAGFLQRYELCSEKCRKAHTLQNKRDFDERARKNNYNLLYKNFIRISATTGGIRSILKN